jgi:hypothetical protein
MADEHSNMTAVLQRLYSQMADSSSSGGGGGGSSGDGGEISVDTIYTGMGIANLEGIVGLLEFKSKSAEGFKKDLEQSDERGTMAALFGILFRGKSMNIDMLANARFIPSLQLLKIKPGSLLGGGGPSAG